MMLDPDRVSPRNKRLTPPYSNKRSIQKEVKSVKIKWVNPLKIESCNYVCGYNDCGFLVSSDQGYQANTSAKPPSDDPTDLPKAAIYICTDCNRPTVILYDKKNNIRQIPGAAPGNKVIKVPHPVRELYDEARTCMSVSCNTAAVLALRKILMNIAVDQGANEGLSFVEYINHLVNNDHISPTNRKWVERIREIGNIANHKIAPISKELADELLEFSEMLLKLIYEYGDKGSTP